MRRALLSILSIVGLVSANHPGITASMSVSAIETAKNELFKHVMQSINSAHIPRVPIPDGHLDGFQIQINEDQNNVDFSVNAAANTFDLSITDLRGNIHISDFLAHIGPLIPIKGYINVDMNGIDAHTSLKLTSVGYNGQTLPSVEVQEMIFNINSNNLSFKIGGDIGLDILNWFIQLFKKELIPFVSSHVVSAVRAKLPGQIQSAILATKGRAQLWKNIKGSDNLMLDISTYGAPKVVGDYLEVGLNGTLYDGAKGEGVYTNEAVAMPMHSAGMPDQVQAFISTAFANSAAKAYLDSHQMKVLSWEYDLPIKFDTTYLNKFFPGLVTKYGNDIPVHAEVEMLKAIDINSFKADQSVEASMSMRAKMYVAYANGTKEMFIDFDLNDILGRFSIYLKDNKITPQIREFHVGSASINISKLGKLNLSLLVWLGNELFEHIQGLINKNLNNYHIAIPTSMMNGMFNLGHYALQINDGYLAVGATPFYVPS